MHAIRSSSMILLSPWHTVDHHSVSSQPFFVRNIYPLRSLFGVLTAFALRSSHQTPLLRSMSGPAVCTRPPKNALIGGGGRGQHLRETT